MYNSIHLTVKVRVSPNSTVLLSLV